ncbi:Bacteroides conjugative transposon TraK protein [Arachidicoccus rhizosphaerae]|uniref:Bacteroides conjugative transposon TraK protein n=1 Tax=Arachidicoccus rhizosphaerae TaxID=551991 RepID=A0A1H3YU09_9BACT|nr:conjugative transposon protein TraK [Arachidicoccus rhizosphaerae]SEA15055.1 Bacteroides conjugative transposon TraK protein [Arachidicoccus rhizosphaerae]
MFQQLKNIDKAFKHVRLLTIVVVLASMAICGYAIAKSYQMVTRAERRIYLLANGKAIEAFSAERKDNIPVEAKDHIKMFHHYFFSLDPDEKVIHEHIVRALNLADGSAKSKYDDLKEDRYYSGIISGNVSQKVVMDSMAFSMDTYPYYFKYYGKEKIIRPTVVVTRSLITEGFLRSVSRSDNNPHGFLIERWRVLENKDLKTSQRSISSGRQDNY